MSELCAHNLPLVWGNGSDAIFPSQSGTICSTSGDHAFPGEDAPTERTLCTLRPLNDVCPKDVYT